MAEDDFRSILAIPAQLPEGEKEVDSQAPTQPLDEVVVNFDDPMNVDNIKFETLDGAHRKETFEAAGYFYRTALFFLLGLQHFPLPFSLPFPF